MKGRDHWCGGSRRWLEVQQMSSADLYWAYAKWECRRGIKMLLLQPIHVMHRYLLFLLFFFILNSIFRVRPREADHSSSLSIPCSLVV